MVGLSVARLAGECPRRGQPVPVHLPLSTGGCAISVSRASLLHSRFVNGCRCVGTMRQWPGSSSVGAEITSNPNSRTTATSIAATRQPAMSLSCSASSWSRRSADVSKRRLQEGNCSPFRGRSAREVAVTPRPARYVVLSGCGGIRRRMISSGLMSSGWLTQDCVRIATSEKPSPMRSAG